MKYFIFIILLLNSSFSYGKISLDEELDQYIILFNYAPVERLPIENKDLYNLGEKLFFDNRLSLKENISCSTCHHPDNGTTDPLAFSIGEGGQGLGSQRQQKNGLLTKRNSIALYNKGHADFTNMFWDGRVIFRPSNQTFYTPEPGLNGLNPTYLDIKSELQNALAAQALFPMVNVLEMRGKEFSHLSNIEVWEKITNKIISSDDYQVLLNKVYNNKDVKINIGHLANAIAYFESRAFQVTQTPWDRYLRGDKLALTDLEKRGAILFSEQAGCARCHHGKHLSNFNFQNVGVPIVLPPNALSEFDYGRYEVVPQNYEKYNFANPPLRQISKTAPYFHNGSVFTLEEVVEHYLNPQLSYANFSINVFNQMFQENYLQNMFFINQPSTINELFSNLHPHVQRNPQLTKAEKDALLEFLTKSLTE